MIALLTMTDSGLALGAVGRSKYHSNSRDRCHNTHKPVSRVVPVTGLLAGAVPAVLETVTVMV